MNQTQPAPSGESKQIAKVVIQQVNEKRVDRPVAAALANAPVAPKVRGYGLPCAKCKTYYAADLDACPVCQSQVRIKPTSAAVPVSPAASILEPSEETPDPDVLEQEREKFLREFKSQVYASHAQINVAESFRCSREENHPGEFEPAEVCKGCYERLNERVDLMEAALHMELKEATQIIYDAVWADTSDTGKTYENAAQALLVEIRKRAGIPTVLGPHQPLTH
jgi:hypothetical protein